jgi:hypothetical protein
MLDREKIAILESKRFYTYVIKEHLNPLFKSYNYKRKGNTWYKVNDDVYIQLKIRKSIHNLGREIAFKFSIKMILNKNIENTVEIHGEKMNWEWDFQNTYGNDVNPFLTKDRYDIKRKKFGWSDWYVIFRENKFDELLYEHILIDFKDYLLPLLEKINNEDLFSKIVNEKHKSLHFNINEFVSKYYR